jgi:hypothetical protein
LVASSIRAHWRDLPNLSSSLNPPYLILRPMMWVYPKL